MKYLYVILALTALIAYVVFDVPAYGQVTKEEEIITKTPKGEFTKDDKTIDIVDIKDIKDGVQVFVKAYKGGEQLGFGKDGTVETERINIYNPQTLVEDPLGDIEKTFYQQATDQFITKRYREDAAEWLKQDLAHTISVIGKSGENIIPGKIGNTVSTYYAQANAVATSSMDGICLETDAGTSGAVWNTVHDKASCDSATVTDTNDWFVATRVNSGDTSTRIVRGTFGFYIEPELGTDTVDSATMSLYITGSQTRNDANDWFTITQSVIAASNTLATGDYDTMATATAYSDFRPDISNATSSQYIDFPLNAAGKAAIITASTTQIGTMQGYDYLDVQPGLSSTYDYVLTNFADNGTNLPKLIVTHSAAVGGGSTAVSPGEVFINSGAGILINPGGILYVHP